MTNGMDIQSGRDSELVVQYQVFPLLPGASATAVPAIQPANDAHADEPLRDGLPGKRRHFAAAFTYPLLQRDGNRIVPRHRRRCRTLWISAGHFCEPHRPPQHLQLSGDLYAHLPEITPLRRVFCPLCRCWHFPSAQPRSRRRLSGLSPADEA